MFLGQFAHNLDEKGRLTIPARFRDVLVVEGGYVMQGFDQNLMVLPSAAFDAINKKVIAMNMADPNARVLRRLVYSGADQLEVDRAGRILIPQFLRQAADLVNEVQIVGAGSYFEIWSPEHWAAQTAQLQDAQSLAQRFVGLELTSI